MSSIDKIEQIISDIENYLANSKPRMFSSTEVIVNREEMEELLKELRRKTPDEIKQYQKIIANKDAILADAAARAEAMKTDAEQQARALLEQATVEHNQMISEHEIMLRAHARADEFVNMAVNKAQGIIDNATLEANNLKDAANNYMAEVLEHLSKIIDTATNSATTNYSRSVQSTQDSYDKLMTGLTEYQNVIRENMRQLQAAMTAPAQEAVAPEEEAPAEE